MFFVMRTQVWVLPESKLTELRDGLQLMGNPGSVEDALELCVALRKWPDLSTYADVCIESNTVVVIPRKKGLLDKVASNPWTYAFALTSVIPSVAIAGAVDAVLNKNPKGTFSETDRMVNAISGELTWPKIASKYGVDVSEQLHIRNPFVLVTGRTRNAFQRWQFLSADKSTCMHVFIGELQMANKRTRGIIAYLLSDETSPDSVVKQFITKAGLAPGQLKQIAPLDLSEKNIASRGLGV